MPIQAPSFTFAAVGFGRQTSVSDGPMRAPALPGVELISAPNLSGSPKNCYNSLC